MTEIQKMENGFKFIQARPEMFLESLNLKDVRLKFFSQIIGVFLRDRPFEFFYEDKGELGSIFKFPRPDGVQEFLEDRSPLYQDLSFKEFWDVLTKFLPCGVDSDPYPYKYYHLVVVRAFCIDEKLPIWYKNGYIHVEMRLDPKWFN